MIYLELVIWGRNCFLVNSTKGVVVGFWTQCKVRWAVDFPITWFYSALPWTPRLKRERGRDRGKGDMFFWKFGTFEKTSKSSNWSIQFVFQKSRGRREHIKAIRKSEMRTGNERKKETKVSRRSKSKVSLQNFKHFLQLDTQIPIRIVHLIAEPLLEGVDTLARNLRA